MADDKNNKDEPSIEEILSSIRDIISDDDDKTPLREVVPQDKDDEQDSDDDVLELSEIIEENDENSEVVSEDSTDSVYDPLAGIDFSHPEDDLDIIEDEKSDDHDAAVDVFESLSVEDDESSFNENDQDDSFVNMAEDEPTQSSTVAQKTISEPSHDDEALIDRIAETATVSAMAKLAENIAVSRKTDGITLEEIVRDLMRPMLKDWLDENLPTIIDRVVTKELERLAEKAIRK